MKEAVTLTPVAQAASFLEPLGGIDWTNVDKIREVSEPVMRGLAENKTLLGGLVRGITTDPERRELCERDYGLYKYVLYSDPQNQFRLRLHIMQQDQEETPHAHRNCFASLILRGGYEHTFYAPIDNGEKLIDCAELTPILRRWEGEGTHYAVHHSLIHFAQAKTEPCITLMLRGPSMRRRAINLDFNKHVSWWHRGAADLSAEETALVSRLTENDIANMIKLLESKGVI